MVQSTGNVSDWRVGDWSDRVAPLGMRHASSCAPINAPADDLPKIICYQDLPF